MSRRARWNTLACLKYRGEFGPKRVFSLRNAEERDVSDRERPADEFRAPRLFGDDITYQKLASLLARGAEIRAINLNSEFDLAAYKEKNGSSILPMFTLTTEGKLRVINDDAPVEEMSEGKLLALVWSADG